MYAIRSYYELGQFGFPLGRGDDPPVEDGKVLPREVEDLLPPLQQQSRRPGVPRITSYNVCYTKLLRDEFLEVLYVDDVLNANPRIKEARDRVPKAYLKYRVTSLVCQSAGGPEKYTGRTMKESHAHLIV